MRTYEEMVNRIDTLNNDIFGNMVSDDILIYLPFKYAKKYLKDDVNENEWEDERKEYTEENVKKEIKDYISFAWQKAIRERGLSAVRSMKHFENWFWLLGENEIEKMTRNYNDYGKNNIEKIAEWLGLKEEDYKQEL